MPCCEGSLRISGVTEAGKEAILSMVEPPMWLGEISCGRIKVLDRGWLVDIAGLSCVDKALLGQTGPAIRSSAG